MDQIRRTTAACAGARGGPTLAVIPAIGRESEDGGTCAAAVITTEPRLCGCGAAGATNGLAAARWVHSSAAAETTSPASEPPCSWQPCTGAAAYPAHNSRSHTTAVAGTPLSAATSRNASSLGTSMTQTQYS